MSLDVYLELKGASVPHGSGIFVRENGQTKEISRQEWDEKFPGLEPATVVQSGESSEVYSANITHNLSKMAAEAGIYEHLWRPDEINITHAHQLVEPLEQGLKRLTDDPDHFRQFNPANGWGDYEGLVEFVQNYLNACKKWGDAEVRAWR